MIKIALKNLILQVSQEIILISSDINLISSKTAPKTFELTFSGFLLYVHVKRCLRVIIFNEAMLFATQSIRMAYTGTYIAVSLLECSILQYIPGFAKLLLHFVL